MANEIRKEDFEKQLAIAGDMAEQLGLAVAAEIRALARKIEQPALEGPKLRRIICRKRDVNARGRGSEEYRRVMLPNGEGGWATDFAVNLSGDWSYGGSRADDRRCSQWGEFPVGTVVLELTKSVPAHGPAETRAGHVVSFERGKELRRENGYDDGKSSSIEWGLPTRLRGRRNTEVKINGKWVEV